MRKCAVLPCRSQVPSFISGFSFLFFLEKKWLLKNIIYLKLGKTEGNLVLSPVDRRLSLAWLWIL